MGKRRSFVHNPNYPWRVWYTTEDEVGGRVWSAHKYLETACAAARTLWRRGMGRRGRPLVRVWVSKAGSDLRRWIDDPRSRS